MGREIEREIEGKVRRELGTTIRLTKSASYKHASRLNPDKIVPGIRVVTVLILIVYTVGIASTDRRTIMFLGASSWGVCSSHLTVLSARRHPAQPVSVPIPQAYTIIERYKFCCSSKTTTQQRYIVIIYQVPGMQ